MKYLKVWTSFLDIIRPKNEENGPLYADDEIGRLFVMMLEYAESGKAPVKFAGNERFVWPAAKQWIDLTFAENEKQRKNGKKGGRPKTQENPEKPNETQENPNEPNETLKVKKNNRKESNGKECNGKQSINIVPLKRFVPPTVDEIKEYCDRRGSWLIDPQAFIDYYEARGWMLNKDRKMVNWKAAVRTWENNERERKKKESYADLPY